MHQKKLNELLHKGEQAIDLGRDKTAVRLLDDKGRHVVAWIWRQTTAEPIELLSLSKSELEGIVATIRNSATTRFTVYELRSTERGGNHQKVRAYKLSEGEFTVEECKE